MNKDIVNSFLNMHIRLIVDAGELRDSKVFTGYIRNILDNTLIFEDKFGSIIAVELSNILRIEEVKNGHN